MLRNAAIVGLLLAVSTAGCLDGTRDEVGAAAIVPPELAAQTRESFHDLLELGGGPMGVPSIEAVAAGRGEGPTRAREAAWRWAGAQQSAFAELCRDAGGSAVVQERPAEQLPECLRSGLGWICFAGYDVVCADADRDAPLGDGAEWVRDAIGSVAEVYGNWPIATASAFAATLPKARVLAEVRADRLATLFDSILPTLPVWAWTSVWEPWCSQSDGVAQCHVPVQIGVQPPAAPSAQ